MADIVERLREACRTPTGYEMPDHSEPWGVDCGFLREAATELEALRKRCEAVEADAEKYRWLIANQVEYRDCDDGLAWMTMQWNLGPASLAPGCIDAAISQAIAAAQEPSHG